MNSENILLKLKNSEEIDWSNEEKEQLLKIYYIISKKEDKIFNLIYSLHDSDTYEDIFRDFNIQNIKDKAQGVNEALELLLQKK